MKLECKELGMTMLIVKNSEQSAGKSLEMEWELAPFLPSPPVHIHPNAVETYEILEGEMEFQIDGDWVKAGKGDKLRVDKDVPHTFRNNNDKPVRLYNTHQPAMDFEGFFKGLHTFSKSGSFKNGKLSLTGIIGISTLYMNYQKEIVSVKPPAIAMKFLSFIGRLRGINFR